MGQLVVGHFLDRLGPRTVFIRRRRRSCASIMPGRADWAALACAMAFMLAAFGQIPINDFMIGHLAEGEWRARIYGVRFVVGFTVLAAALPLIAVVYENWGINALLRRLAVAAARMLGAVVMLPRRPCRLELSDWAQTLGGMRGSGPRGLICATRFAKSAIASAALARLPLRVNPEPPRGPRSWSPSPAQCMRIARDSP
jgi:hypothetical protein